MSPVLLWLAEEALPNAEKAVEGEMDKEEVMAKAMGKWKMMWEEMGFWERRAEEFFSLQM